MNCLGSSRLDDPTADSLQLFESLCNFCLANDLHIQLQGIPESLSLYNMACSCGRLASLRLTDSGALTSPSLPPWLTTAHAVDTCLNAALAWLVAAVGAGWRNVAHTQVDTDLVAVRSQRAAVFAIVLQLAQ
jgi:hypothetical protein